MPNKSVTVLNGDGSTRTITIPDRSRYAGRRTINSGYVYPPSIINASSNSNYWTATMTAGSGGTEWVLDSDLGNDSVNNFGTLKLVPEGKIRVGKHRVEFDITVNSGTINNGASKIGDRPLVLGVRDYDDDPSTSAHSQIHEVFEGKNTLDVEVFDDGVEIPSQNFAPVIFLSARPSSVFNVTVSNIKVTHEPREVTVDRTARVHTSDRKGESRPLLSKVVGGAAAAYSLRDLNDRTGNNNVVRVRRESDNSEKDFRAKEVSNGTMARWVNEQPTLPLDLRELDTNTGERDGALIEAAAAYSLRKLKEDFTGDVVEVRRNVDGETEGFTADEVTDGTLESFVNASFDDELPLDQATGAAAAYSLRSLGTNQWEYAGDTLEYESDFSAGTDGWFATNATPAIATDPTGTEDVLKVTVDASADPKWGYINSQLTVGHSYLVQAEVYVPSSNESVDSIVLMDGAGGMATSYLGIQTDEWVTVSTAGTSTSGSFNVRAADGTTQTAYTGFQGNGTDVFYVRNVKIYENIGDTEYLPSGKYVVQVRRSSDDAVKSFTASEVADGTLEDWAGELHNYLPLPSSFGHWVTQHTGGQTDPDGGAGAYLLTHVSGSTTDPNARASNVSLDAGTYTFSCYFKEGTWDVVSLFVDDYDGTSFWQHFDLSSGSLGADRNGNVDNATITDVGSGWYFCTMTVTSSTAVYDAVGVGLHSDTPFASASGETAYYYQPHVVRGTEPATEYIAKSVPILGDGFVRTWYDQSGSDNHAVQTTPANQPKIVEGGSLETRNGSAAIKSTSDNEMLFTLDSLSADGQQSVFAVLENDITAEVGYGTEFFRVSSSSASSAGANRRPRWICTPTGQLVFTVDSLTGYNNTDREYRLYSHIMNDDAGGTSTIHQDGTQVDTRSITLDANATFSDGKVLGVDTTATGAFYMSEVIYYPSDQSDKRRAIEENIANHYDISLAAFSRDGTVSTWYDQSETNGVPNANHTTQTDPTKQPKIVDGGTLNSDGIYFDGTNDELNSPSINFGDNPNTIFTLFKNDNSSAQTYFLSLGNIDNLMWFYGTRILYAGTNITGSTMSSNQELWSAFFDNPNDTGTLHVNGTQDVSGNIGTRFVGTETIRIGANGGANAFNGWFKEVIIYNSDQSDNRTAIEANIGETYGITDIPAANDTVNGYVETWYDQSGNGYDAREPAAGYQPKIVENGSLVTDNNGKIAIKGTGSKLRLGHLPWLGESPREMLSSDGTHSLFIVCDLPDQTDGNRDYNFISRFYSTSLSPKNRRPQVYLIRADGNLRCAAEANQSKVTVNSSDAQSAQLITDIVNPSGTTKAEKHSVYVDGTFKAEQPYGTSWTSDGNTALHQNAVLFARGETTVDTYISEVVYYPSDQSSNRPAIEANILNQYDI